MSIFDVTITYFVALLTYIVIVFQSLAFQKIGRIITAVDSQPMFDGGVLINVLGQLQVCFNIHHWFHFKYLQIIMYSFT